MKEMRVDHGESVVGKQQFGHEQRVVIGRAQLWGMVAIPVDQGVVSKSLDENLGSAGA